MAPPGPPPIPKALKLLRGGHPERINAHEPVPRAGLPTLPEGEEIAPAVRKVWDRVLPELIAMGTAHAADSDALLCYCAAVARHRESMRYLAISPVLLKGDNGRPVRNVAVAIQRDAALEVRALAQEFGLTPSSRSRIDTGSRRGEEENIWAGSG